MAFSFIRNLFSRKSESSKGSRIPLVFDLVWIEEKCQKAIAEISARRKLQSSFSDSIISLIEKSPDRSPLQLWKLPAREEKKERFLLEIAPLCFAYLDEISDYPVAYCGNIQANGPTALLNKLRQSGYAPKNADEFFDFYFSTSGRPFSVHCPICKASGYLSCRRCGGKGKIKAHRGGSVRCDSRRCNKGRVSCPACRGDGLYSCSVFRQDDQLKIALPKSFAGSAQPPLLIDGRKVAPASTFSSLIVESQPSRSGQNEIAEYFLQVESRFTNALDEMSYHLRIQREALSKVENSIDIREITLIHSDGVFHDYRAAAPGRVNSLNEDDFFVLLPENGRKQFPLEQLRVDNNQVFFTLKSDDSGPVRGQGTLVVQQSLKPIISQQRAISWWKQKPLRQSPLKLALADPRHKTAVKGSRPLRPFNSMIAKNEDQMAVVNSVVSATYPLHCVQGPPGTGKTSVISEIALQELHLRAGKVLISSQSNLAVDNVLEKLDQIPGVVAVRLGHTSKIAPQVSHLAVDTVANDTLLSIRKNVATAVKKTFDTIASANNLFAQEGLLDRLESDVLLLKKVEQSTTVARDRMMQRMQDLEKRHLGELVPMQDEFNKKNQEIEQLEFEHSDLVTQISEIPRESIVRSKALLQKLEADLAIANKKTNVVDNKDAERLESECEALSINIEALNYFLEQGGSITRYLGYLHPEARKHFDTVRQKLTGLSKRLEEKSKDLNAITERIDSWRKSLLEANKGLYPRESSELDAALQQHSEAKQKLRSTWRELLQELKSLGYPTVSELSLQLLKNSPDFARALIEEWIETLERRSKIQQRWLSYLQSMEDRSREFIKPFAHVIGATCVGSDTHFLNHFRRNQVSQRERDQLATLVVVDEAGRSTPMETLIPMMYSRRAVLIGDQKQLPPHISPELRAVWKHHERSVDIEDSIGSISYFEQLQKTLPADRQFILRTQFRMHPQIGSLVSSLFYKEEGLVNGVFADEREVPLEGFPEAISYHSTRAYGAKRFERALPGEHSKFNHAEVSLLSSLLTHVDGLLDRKTSFSVITFYRAQVDLIKKQLSALNFNYLTESGEDSTVATLDSFQGREDDFIFISFVRSPQSIHTFDAEWLRFFLDVNRLNVALSRAKSRVFLIGDLDHILRVTKNRGDIPGFRVLEELMEFIDSNSLRVEGKELPGDGR